MSDPGERPIFETISRGEISRAEAGRRLGRQIDFAEMILGLRDHGLPMPRFPTNPQAVRLVRDAVLAAERSSGR